MANSKSISRNNLGMETLEAFTPSRRTRTLSAGQVSLEVIPSSCRKRQGRRPMPCLFVAKYKGEKYPFCFDGKDQEMLYIYTIMRIKNQRMLLRNELESNYCPVKGWNDNWKKTNRDWFERVFIVVYPQRDRSFDDWQHTFAIDKQRLSQAKSRVTRIIEKATQCAPKEVLEACGLQKKKVKGNTTAYFIQLAPEQIILPDAWEELVEQMPIRA